MLTPPTSPIHLFWTAYEPLDMASDSMDVLGLQSGYVLLADHFLPGLTTVTTSPRYLSMLCAAVLAAEQCVSSFGQSSASLRQDRLIAVKSYERAWALACVLASSISNIGQDAVDGLRGVRSVRRRLEELSSREHAIRTSSFNLLANQVRYGGIGAYSTMLESCYLASMSTVSVRALGAELGRAFPQPPRSLQVWEEDRLLGIESLKDWGTQCHLKSFTTGEARCLRQALKGDTEADWDDDIRWLSLRLIAKTNNQECPNERSLLAAVANLLQSKDSLPAKTPDGCWRQVQATVLLIPPYEVFCQILQFLFDDMRAATSDKPEVSLSDIATRAAMVTACREVSRAAKELLIAIDRSSEIHQDSTSKFVATVSAVGLISLAQSLVSISDAELVLKLVLDRHREIQYGKLDGGLRKSTWLQPGSTPDRIRLTSQRHELPLSERHRDWTEIPWHHYRTSGARRFVQACQIR